MQEIQNREVPRLVRVERGRKNDAIGNAAGQDFAGDRVALDAAGREEWTRENTEGRSTKGNREADVEAYS